MSSTAPDFTATGLDVSAIRADFPILQQTVHGQPLVYLDSGATSQKPQAVLNAEIDFLTRANSAVHRGAHTLAGEATELFEDARATVSGFLGTRPEQLVWTSGATFALVAKVTDPVRVGGVTGLVGAAGGIGGFVPPLIMGYVYRRTASFGLGLLLLSITAGLTLILTLTVVRSTANRAQAAAQATTPRPPDHGTSMETA